MLCFQVIALNGRYPQPNVFYAAGVNGHANRIVEISLEIGAVVCFKRNMLRSHFFNAVKRQYNLSATVFTVTQHIPAEFIFFEEVWMKGMFLGGWFVKTLISDR